MRTLLTWTLHPLLFGLALFLVAAGQRAGLALEVAFGLTTVALSVALALLERVHPYRAEWRQSDGQLVNDLTHGVLGTTAGGGAGQAANNVIVAFVFTHLPALGPDHGPMASLPFWAQVGVGIVVVDLGRYVQHRFEHAVPLLWRFHKLHHDSVRLTVWKGGRAHVVERFFQAICMFLPLLLLGYDDRVVIWCMCVHSFLGSIAHSNVDLRLGVLGYIVNGPEQHRIHHSRDRKEGTSNLGSALVLFDILFGTFLDPRRRGPVSALGIDEPSPPGFFAQLRAPFLSSKSG